VVDVHGPGGLGLSAIGTGHLRTIAAPGDGILARQRGVRALAELRVPFELDRQAIDDVGAARTTRTGNRQRTQRDSRLCRGPRFDGYAAAGIGGIRQGPATPS
jgi:uncharacterized linocin/CFP29 family protein